MKGYVYALICAETRVPFYIGCTENSPAFRLQTHINLIRTGKMKVYIHMRQKEIVPDIKVLETIDFIEKNDLFKAEFKWIQKYLKKNIKLVNTSKTNPNAVFSEKRKGGTVIIPEPQFKEIKKYAKYNGLLLGVFVANAAMEKIERLKQEILSENEK